MWVRGDIYGLVGPNGAGKSTLIRHLTGVYRQDAGEIYIDGEEVYENRKVKSEIAYIPDELFYFLQADTLEMKRYYKGIYESFDEKMFERMKKYFPAIDVKRNIRRLSKGMQKQVAFWLAICCKPKVLILDEPVDGLDPVMRRQIWSILLSEVEERKMTVLVSSHNLRELEDVCDHVGIMNQGQIIIERSLSELQGNICKIQVACQTGMPKLPPEFEVLHMSNIGRVYTVIVKGSPKAAAEAIMTDPEKLAIVDILPLTLEEIFIYEMGGLDYEVKDILFNKAIYKKNFTLYWPIWVCYLLYGLVKVPGSLWSGLRQHHMTQNLQFSVFADSLSIRLDVWAIAVMVAVTGMALFSYLFSAKSANLIHALPVTRKELYFTNVLSGFTFLFIPQLITFMVTVVVCLANGITQVEYVGLWLVSVMGIGFFLFSLVCLCAMFTGQLLALPVYFLVGNFLSVGIIVGVRYVLSFLGYGISFSQTPDFLLFRILSPINYLYNNVRIWSPYTFDDIGDQIFSGVRYCGLNVVIGYVVAAVFIYALAYYCYKKRRIESAGDLLTFGWIKPLFRWGSRHLCRISGSCDSVPVFRCIDAVDFR